VVLEDNSTCDGQRNSSEDQMSCCWKVWARDLVFRTAAAERLATEEISAPTPSKVDMLTMEEVSE